MLVTTAITTVLATAAMAQTANSNLWGVKTPLFDKVAGKLNLTANVGYVHNLASKWDSSVGNGNANGHGFTANQLQKSGPFAVFIGEGFSINL